MLLVKMILPLSSKGPHKKAEKKLLHTKKPPEGNTSKEDRKIMKMSSHFQIAWYAHQNKGASQSGFRGLEPYISLQQLTHKRQKC